MRKILPIIYFQNVSSWMLAEDSRNKLDYGTWHSPIVFSGTCKSLNGKGECSEINVWHVYKGKELFTEDIMTTEKESGFDINVIRSFEATNLKKSQTSIFYGNVEDEKILLQAEVSNIHLDNLNRVSDVVKFQNLNPEATVLQAQKAGFNINDTRTEYDECIYGEWSSWGPCECSETLSLLGSYRMKYAKLVPGSPKECEKQKEGSETWMCIEYCDPLYEQQFSTDEKTTTEATTYNIQEQPTNTPELIPEYTRIQNTEFSESELRSEYDGSGDVQDDTENDDNNEEYFEDEDDEDSRRLDDLSEENDDNELEDPYAR